MLNYPPMRSNYVEYTGGTDMCAVALAKEAESHRQRWQRRQAPQRDTGAGGAGAGGAPAAAAKATAAAAKAAAAAAKAAAAAATATAAASEVGGEKAPLMAQKLIAEYDTKLAKLGQENFDLRLYCYNLEEKVKEQWQLLNSSSKTVVELQTENRELRASIERKANLLIQGSKALDQLKSKLEIALEEKYQLRNGLNQQDLQIEDLMRKNEALCSTSCHLKQLLQCLEEQCMASEARRLELEEIVNNSSYEIASLKARLREFGDNLEQMKMDRIQMEMEFNSLRSHSEKACKELADALEKVQKLSDRIRQSQNEQKGSPPRKKCYELETNNTCLECLREENQCLMEQLKLLPKLRCDIELFEKEEMQMRAELLLEQKRNEQLRSEYESRFMQQRSGLEPGADSGPCTKPMHRPGHSDHFRAHLQDLSDSVVKRRQHIDNKCLSTANQVGHLVSLLESLLQDAQRNLLPGFGHILETDIDDTDTGVHVLNAMRPIVDECFRQLYSLRDASVQVADQLEVREFEDIAWLSARIEVELRSLRSLVASGAKRWLRMNDDEAWNLAGGSSAFTFCCRRSDVELRSRRLQIHSELRSAPEQLPLQVLVNQLASRQSIDGQVSAWNSIGFTIVKRLVDLEVQIPKIQSSCEVYELLQFLLSDIQQISLALNYAFDSIQTSGAVGEIEATADVIRQIIDDCADRLGMLQEAVCSLPAVRVSEAEGISKLSATAELDVRSLRGQLVSRIKTSCTCDDSSAWHLSTRGAGQTVNYTSTRPQEGKNITLKEMQELLNRLKEYLQHVQSEMGPLGQSNNAEETTKRLPVVESMKDISKTCVDMKDALSKTSGQEGFTDECAIECVISILTTMVDDKAVEPLEKTEKVVSDEFACSSMTNPSVDLDKMQNTG